jgi:hypothetical protein
MTTKSPWWTLRRTCTTKGRSNEVRQTNVLPRWVETVLWTTERSSGVSKSGCSTQRGRTSSEVNEVNVTKIHAWGPIQLFCLFLPRCADFPGKWAGWGLFSGKICAEVFFRESSILRKNSFVENFPASWFYLTLRASPKFSQSGFSYNTVKILFFDKWYHQIKSSFPS